MSESKSKTDLPEKSIAHTPGPWRVAAPGDPVLSPDSGIHYPTTDTCILTDAGVAVISGSEWLNVSDADARLIAAAPELLEALKSMDCAVCDCSLGHPMRVIDRCSFCAKSRAAIAKAEGREGR